MVLFHQLHNKTIVRLTPEDKLVLSCVKLNPNETEYEELNQLICKIENWNKFLINIIERGVSPLLYVKLVKLPNSHKIPKFVIQKLKKTYYLTINRSVKLQDSFRIIAEAFNFADIPIIALKGVYLSEWLYKDIGLRQFSDIDLLIREEDNIKCFSLLDDLGFFCYDGIESEHINGQEDLMHYKPRLNKQGVCVELHIKIHHNNVKYNFPVEKLWQSSTKGLINGVEISVLEFNDNLIYLTLHLDKHFKNGHVQFTCFNDIVNILTECADEINWTHLNETCKKYNCNEIVFMYFILVEKYFNVLIPNYIHNEYKTLLEIKTEKIFLKYLRGYSSYQTTHLEHIANLKSKQSVIGRLKYIIDVIFPSKSFMIEKYNINNHYFVLLYYPYRYYVGIRGLFFLLSGKMTNKNSK